MKTAAFCGIFIWISACEGHGWDMRVIPLADRGVSKLEQYSASCALDYYYLVDGCAYVTVIAGLSEDQSMNVKICGADGSGEPVGQVLGNRSFSPLPADTIPFTTSVMDFTGGGQQMGFDLSGCRGEFVVILTWKNTTGHPGLVLDNVSTCVDSCAVEAACCQMGTAPYIYPGVTTHTYDLGFEGAWGKQDSFRDPGSAGTYGYLEALWTCRFCHTSAATLPTSWGAIKALYQ